LIALHYRANYINISNVNISATAQDPFARHKFGWLKPVFPLGSSMTWADIAKKVTASVSRLFSK
jgi:hypothetical protein